MNVDNVAAEKALTHPLLTTLFFCPTRTRRRKLLKEYERIALATLASEDEESEYYDMDIEAVCNQDKEAFLSSLEEPI